MTKNRTSLAAKYLLLILLLWNFQLAAGVELNADAEWDDGALNTASSATYLSAFEKEIVLEINKLRSNPAKYADDYIAPLANSYNGNLLYYPGDKPLRTKEGKKALTECLRVLKNQRALPLIYPSEGLSKAARDHVDDQSASGKTGHVGRDRSRVKNRVERYGEWKVRIAENIAYGGISARQVVVYLLIDDGIKDRGHRKNFFNPDLNLVGVAAGSHPYYEVMCVMDFAGMFEPY